MKTGTECNPNFDGIHSVFLYLSVTENRHWYFDMTLIFFTNIGIYLEIPFLETI